jgi:imidazole glycerol phosphate synthase glutamine amidotransferase subunit
MMRALDALQVRAAFTEVIRAGVPFLGICLGLQALFTSSDEAPEVEGLGIFEGQVRRFPHTARVPHMGWNELESRSPSRLLARLDARPHVYFAHSYYVPETAATAASCNYCVPYTAVLDSGNIFGVQFHPEKSGPVGLQIVKNFVDL